MPTFQHEKEGSIFSEGRRAETGVGFLVWEQWAPQQLGDLGECCKLPSGSRAKPRPVLLTNFMNAFFFLALWHWGLSRHVSASQAEYHIPPSTSIFGKSPLYFVNVIPKAEHWSSTSTFQCRSFLVTPRILRSHSKKSVYLCVPLDCRSLCIADQDGKN